MKTKMFSVFDMKAAVYSAPFFMPREEMAIRAFADGVNDGRDPNNNWAKHPEDFSLFYIGEFDDELAVATSVNPRPLVSAAAVKSIRPGAPVVSEEVLNHIADRKLFEGVR